MTSIEKTKILFCEPVEEESEGGTPPQLGWWQKTVELVGKSGTTVDFGGLRKAYSGPTPFAQSYNGIQMALRAHEAEKTGYDVFIIGCASDMGLRECRAMANIPVVAPTEATALLASTLGYKFSAINLQPSADAGIEEAIRNAGLVDKLASVRSPSGLTIEKAFQMSMSSDKEEQKKLVKMLTTEMSKAVNEDRAEALFISCTHTSAFFTMQGVREVEGVPILDLFAASLKLAETLADLERGLGTKVCKRSIYLAPPVDWEKQKPSKTL